MPAGRPTSYDPELIEPVKKLALLGATDAQIAGFIGVALSTLKLWKQAHPEFSAALKKAKDELDSKVVQSLYRRASGYVTKDSKIVTKDGTRTQVVRTTKHYPPDPVSMIFWLKNRQPELWRDKRELDVHRTDTSRMTDSEIERLILTGNKGKKDKDQPVKH